MSIRQNVRRANLGGCRISKKRVDREWGPWELAETIDDGEEWKITIGREMLVDAAHNGKEGADYDKNVTSWLKFLKRAMAWDAKAACVQELFQAELYEADCFMTSMELQNNWSFCLIKWTKMLIGRGSTKETTAHGCL